MNKLKHVILSVTVAVFSGIGVVPALPSVALALDSKTAACQAINNGGNCPAAAGVSLALLVKSILNILGIALGVIAIFMIVIAGFKYMTSGGDASQVASAKSTLIYAIVGLVVAAMAEFIVRFVLTNVK
jgi:hypothetical protein